MKVRLEKKTTFLGKIEYVVWVENPSAIFQFKCIGVYDTLSEADKVFEETCINAKEPKVETIKEQII
jgi:hypothetical protein